MQLIRNWSLRWVDTRTMHKPSQPILSAPSSDVGIGTRVARRLEHSPLHVVRACVCMTAPAGLDTGFPDLPWAGQVEMMLELALVTDAERGWLVLAPSTDEWDVETECGDFIDDCRSSITDPPPCVVRAASLCSEDRGGLGLREIEGSRAVIEAEFEQQFAGRTPADVGALLRVFRNYGYYISDEAELRREMNEAG